MFCTTLIILVILGFTSSSRVMHIQESRSQGLSGIQQQGGEIKEIRNLVNNLQLRSDEVPESPVEAIAKLDDRAKTQMFHRKQRSTDLANNDLMRTFRDMKFKHSTPVINMVRHSLPSNYIMKEKPCVARGSTIDEFDQDEVTDSTVSLYRTESTQRTFPTTDKIRIKTPMYSTSTLVLPHLQFVKSDGNMSARNNVVNERLLSQDVNENGRCGKPTTPKCTPKPKKKCPGKSVKESYGLVIKAENRYDECTTDGGKIKFSEMSAEVMSEMERIENVGESSNHRNEDSMSIKQVQRGRSGYNLPRYSRALEPAFDVTSDVNLEPLIRTEQPFSASEGRDSDDDDDDAGEVDADDDTMAFRHVHAPRIEYT